MNILVMDKVSKTYGDKVILDNVSLGIEKGEKIGLLGINGSGKTSLLKLIGGGDEPDGGSIIRNNNLRMNFLPQNPDFAPDITVLAAVLNSVGDVAGAEAWTLESDARSILTRLGIDDFDAPMGQLSGGQRKRTALAAALLRPADLLVLDEPTNHLDNRAIDWLEKYLLRYTGTLLMVTHDRYFLERVAGRIIEIELSQLYTYPGNWSTYLELKLARQESEAATLSKKHSLLRQELAWIRRGARARSTKQKARIERFEKLQEELNTTVQKDLEISSAASRLGKKVIVMQDVSYSCQGETLVKDFSCLLARDERLGIVGPNGIGKSTLLRIMSGELLPDSGTVDIGATVKIGFFPQESIDLPGDMRVIDYIREAGEYLSAGKKLLSAAQMLETFLFPPATHWTTLQKLSGGEKRRLHLLRILMTAPNVLLLDEPGNDLDIETLIILEHYLDTFPGAVAAVSHDRYFLDRITRKTLAFTGEGRLQEFAVNYSDYLSQIAAQPTARTRTNRSGSASPRQPVPFSGNDPVRLKFSFKEQKQFEVIEDHIETIESQLRVVDQQIEQAASDYQLLQELASSRQALEERHEHLLEQWAYLNELAEAIAKQR